MRTAGPANAHRCEGPPPEWDKRFTTCAHDALYWVDTPEGRKAVCHPHYQQVAVRKGPLRPLASRKWKKPVGTCKEPGVSGKCGRPGPYVKYGRPMCDTHCKQMDRQGTTWTPGTRRTEAA